MCFHSVFSHLELFITRTTSWAVTSPAPISTQAISRETQLGPPQIHKPFLCFKTQYYISRSSNVWSNPICFPDIRLIFLVLPLAWRLWIDYGTFDQLGNYCKYYSSYFDPMVTNQANVGPDRTDFDRTSIDQPT